MDLADHAAQAKREFEVLPADFRYGTSKRYSRGDFLPLDDPRGLSEGDFIGRLRALFGPREDDQYELRHRETGFVVTAYAAQSGPSYGGGPRHPGPLPEGDRAPSHAELYAQSQAQAARIAADPELSAGRAVDWSKHPPASLSREALQALREKQQAWHRRRNDVAAPPGFAAVVARLDQLLSAVDPVDWEATRYWGDPPSVYRIGARAGVAINEKLPPTEALLSLLERAEPGEPPVKERGGDAGLGVNKQVVDYWLYRAKKGKRLDALLPRVQAAWFRLVEGVQGQDSPELRDLFLKQAEEQVGPLGIDARAAAAALRPASRQPGGLSNKPPSNRRP